MGRNRLGVRRVREGGGERRRRRIEDKLKENFDMHDMSERMKWYSLSEVCSCEA